MNPDEDQGECPSGHDRQCARAARMAQSVATLRARLAHTQAARDRMRETALRYEAALTSIADTDPDNLPDCAIEQVIHTARKALEGEL